MLTNKLSFTIVAQEKGDAVPCVASSLQEQLNSVGVSTAELGITRLIAKNVCAVAYAGMTVYTQWILIYRFTDSPTSAGVDTVNNLDQVHHAIT